MNTTLNIKPNESKCLSLLRCLSVIMIVSCHILQGLGNDWAWIFNIGVQIFFIISSYLYGRKLIEDSISWYKKRSIKILTPYYIYIIFVSIVISIWQPNVFSWKQEMTYFTDLQGV